MLPPKQVLFDKYVLKRSRNKEGAPLVEAEEAESRARRDRAGDIFRGSETLKRIFGSNPTVQTIAGSKFLKCVFASLADASYKSVQICNIPGSFFCGLSLPCVTATPLGSGSKFEHISCIISQFPERSFPDLGVQPPSTTTISQPPTGSFPPRKRIPYLVNHHETTSRPPPPSQTSTPAFYRRFA